MRACLVLCGLLLVSCAAPRRGGTLHTSYDPHTQVGLRSVAEFDALSLEGAGSLRAVKFVISDFDLPGQARLELLDGHFYEFHDEWHWLQLLNGRSLHGDEGLKDSPGFDSPRAAEAWYRRGRGHNLGLRYVGDRLYSPAFYRMALSEPRYLGVGSLIHLPGTETRGELWAFTLEYTDRPDAETLQRFFDVIRTNITAEMAAGLRWVTRSPFQARLARNLAKDDPAWGKLTMPYAALSVPGEVIVYNPGVTAGRLRFVEEGESIVGSADPNYIMVVAEIPDQLPPSAGLISIVPHTPLSHLNILARNRGIPSVYVGGLRNNAYFMQLARAEAPVMLSAQDGRVRVSAMSDAEYASWNESKTFTMRIGTAVDPHSVPLTAELSGDAKATTVAIVGGKSHGMALLSRVPDLALPEPRLAITVRAYGLHTAELNVRVARLLETDLFTNYRRAQVLALEGRAVYDTTFPGRKDRRIAETMLRRSKLIRELVQAGGVKALIRAQPIEPTLLAELRNALTRRFGDLPATQGLRFRSSSTIEDVEGFNGAGLYASSTGFLQPLKARRKREHSRTLQWALKRTWASYWNWEAFAERQEAGMDHMAGSMAVLVHPRFDDDDELSNGVIAFHLSRESGRAEMEVDSQAGALSVTNPPTDREVVPEVVRVTAALDTRGDTTPTVIRVSPSNMTAADQPVMTDAQLLALFTQVLAVAQLHLDEENASLPPAQRGLETTLDLEFRTMAGAWPDGDESRAGRVVLKQVRALTPTPQLPDLLEAGLPVPKHLALRADRLDRQHCSGGNLQVELLRLSVPDRRVPFVPLLRVTRAGETWEFTHLQLTQPDARGVIVLDDESARRSNVKAIDPATMRCTTTAEMTSRSAMLRTLEGRAIDLGIPQPK